MSIPPPTATNLPLPQWAYVPGETAEAEADHLVLQDRVTRMKTTEKTARKAATIRLSAAA